MPNFFDLKNFQTIEQHDNLSSLAQSIKIDGVHQINEEGNPWHIYINDVHKHNEYILIGFSGRVTLDGIKKPPFFSFRGVSEKAGLGIIAFSDPSLNFSNKLSLCWYLGNRNNSNITIKIAQLLDSLIEKTGKKLILAGGSGGGFAALNIHAHMQHKKAAKSFAWNPQTDITKYNNKVLKDYFSACFKQGEFTISEIRRYFEDKNLPHILKKHPDLEQLILINGYDPSHIRKHVRRFIPTESSDKNFIFFGDWGIGHVQPPQSEIIKVLSGLTTKNSLAEVCADLEKPKKELLDFSTHKEILQSKLNGRIALVKSRGKSLIMIRCNIYDLFLGYQVKISIFDSTDKNIFDSNYLLGQDAGEVYLELDPSSLAKMNKTRVRFLIEDHLGNRESYYYDFLKNRKLIKLHQLSL